MAYTIEDLKNKLIEMYPEIKNNSITVTIYFSSVDKDGYLINFDDWNEEVAQVLAEREGFGRLTNQQLDILKFIRDYYKNYNFFPVLNAVCKNVKQPNECMAEYFMEPLVAWKLAGLPKPDETLINIVKYGVTPT